MALNLQNAKEKFINALFGIPAEAEQPDGNVEYIYNTQRQTDFMQGLPSNKDLLGKIQASPYNQGYTDQEIINRVAQGQNFGLPELANEQKEWGIKLPRANNELDEEAVRGNYLNVYQPKLQTGATTTPRQGGFFNDLAQGYQENATQGFNVQNLAPDQNKGLATRIGEGLGTLTRFANSPLGRGLIAYGATRALGYDDPVEQGLIAGVTRQGNVTRDKAYRQGLINMGVDEAQVNAIPGIVSDEIFANFARAKQIQDNAEWKKMYFNAQQEQNKILNEIKEKELAHKQGKEAFDRWMAGKQLSLEEQKLALGWYNAQNKDNEATLNKGDTTFQQLQLLEDAFKNMPQSQARVGKKAKAVLTGVTNMAGLRNDNVTAYEAIRNPLVTTLARSIAGEKGVLTDKDFARAEKMVPTAFDSPEQAQAKFEQIKKLVGVKYGTTPSQTSNDDTMQVGNFKVRIK